MRPRRRASDRVEAAAARLLWALPPRARRAIAGPPIRRDGLELDLDAQVIVRLDARNPRPPVDGRTPAQARGDLRASARIVAGPPLALAEVRDLHVAGADGPLAARLYVPAEALAEGESPLVVFFHGGGWVCGDLDTHDAPCRWLAQMAGTRVLSVDYRRAPEHPYPAPVDDALAAFRDAVARAPGLGADPTRVAVAGDSAGGHLAALVAQRTAADGGPAPALQVLVYPATDLVDDHPSESLFADGFLLTKASMDWYEARFLPDPALAREASPLWTESLVGVAPALVVTAGFDPLRDEGEAYARRLRQAGVPTVLRRHPGQVHGFLNMTGVGRAPREAISEMAGVVRHVLAPRSGGALARAGRDRRGSPEPMPDPILPWPLVRRGAQQHPVKTLQHLLNARGHAVAVDGIFGPLTDGAVRAVQRERGLAVDGIVGPQTWGALIVPVERGATGEAVRGVQEEFAFRNLSGEPGTGLAIDGIFGPRTEAAVRAFQTALSIAVDGIVGPLTWRALVSGMLAL